MRQLLLTAVAAVATLVLGAAPTAAGEVEVAGVHLCCNRCGVEAGKILAKVEGVSDAKADRGKKTVSFKAKDEKAAEAGIKALLDGGFFGAAKLDGKEIKAEAPLPKKGEKADEVVVKGVHVCCNACKTAIGKLFKDVKIDYVGDEVQKDVKISGKGLDKAEVLETLRKEGLNGKNEK